MTPRTYQRHDLDDNHAYDENGILKDGHALRVPLRMMDAMQKDAHEHFSRAKVTDGAGDSDLGLHRPGFRISNTITRDRSVYAAYDAAAEVAYKNVGAGERETLGQRVCDVCRFGPEGARGHLKMINGELTCVADQQEDAASFKDDRAAAYAAKDEYYRTAYRGDGQ